MSTFLLVNFGAQILHTRSEDPGIPPERWTAWFTWEYHRPPGNPEHHFSKLLLMDGIPNNHLGCINPCKWWDIYHINCFAGFLLSTVSFSGCPAVNLWGIFADFLLHLWQCPVRCPAFQEHPGSLWIAKWHSRRSTHRREVFHLGTLG